MTLRSPTIRLFVGSLLLLSLIMLTFRYQPSFKSGQHSNQEEQRQYQKQLEEQHRLEKERYEKQRLEPGISTTTPKKSFEVPQSLHFTHDVAIPHDIPAWTYLDTEALGTTLGAAQMAELLKPEYTKDEDLSKKPERLDFAVLSRAERVYKSLWNHVYPIYEGLPGRNDREKEKALLELAKKRVEIDFFLRLENRLFPWLHYGRYSSFSLLKTFKGRGIVFCAGNYQFEFVITAIQAVRNRLQSKLPIQVYFMGENDLSLNRQTYLREMAADIEVIDVTQTLDNAYMRLGGWAIKPYAMLASSFEEVMFIDADAYFLQDPEVLFNDPGYKAAGALFFYDRTLFPDSRTIPDFMRSILPTMSSFPPISRSFNLLSSHEQESGVVLINKRTRFVGMLATCKMNSKWERDLVSYRKFHGDKETFWVGFEMVQEPYVFMRNYGGVIGELRPDDNQSVCGAQLHQDSEGRPLWWNGGLYRNKNAGVERNLDFGYWMTGGGHQAHRERYTRDSEAMIKVLMEEGLSSSDELQVEEPDAEWDFGESCLKGAKVQMLNAREKVLANGYIGIDRLARKDGAAINRGENVDPKTNDWTNAR